MSFTNITKTLNYSNRAVSEWEIALSLSEPQKPNGRRYLTVSFARFFLNQCGWHEPSRFHVFFDDDNRKLKIQCDDQGRYALSGSKKKDKETAARAYIRFPINFDFLKNFPEKDVNSQRASEIQKGKTRNGVMDHIVFNYPEANGKES
jgi:hypothetical protein